MNLELFIQTNGYNTQKTFSPTPQAYYDKMVNLFNKYALVSDTVTLDQWTILQEIIDIKLIIEEQLKPLDKIGNYHLSVVGGSLRDLLVGQDKDINDYDIVISANSIMKEKIIDLAKEMSIEVNNYDKDLQNIKLFKIAAAKEQKEITGYEWNDDNEKNIIEKIERDFYFSKIVNKLMIGLPGHKCYSENNVREKYMNFHINSINQFNTKTKKVDLIVSQEYGAMFVTTFDFELCKIYADLKNIHTKEELLNNIIPLGSMLRDMEDKTLSVNGLKFPKENLEYFFNKHLLKLIDKYPNHKVNIFAQKAVQEFTSEEKERWIFAHHLKLKNSMPEKGYKVKMKI